MKRDKQFNLQMEEAENELLLFETEAFALETEIDARAGTKAELKSLKKEWLVKEQLLRLLYNI
jgi:hypothetical protein